MEKVGCFSALFLRRNKKKNKASSTAREKTEQTIKPAEADDLKSASSTVGVPNVNRNFMTNCKVMSHESPVGVEAAETAYEGEDEHEENLIKNNVSDFEEENNSIKRNLSDTDLQVPKSSEDETEFYPSNKMDCPHQVDETKVSLHLKHQIEEDASKELDTIKSGHVSDPGIWKAEIWALPMLKRSCSNLETSNVLRTIANGLPPSNSQSFEELQELAEKVKKDFAPGSPLSVMTHGSADKVMLKKHSSSQILPSRSRRLWWKLFLWSHRNLNQSWSIKRRQPHIRVSNKQGGYSSDTLEPSRPIELSKPESPGSFTGESLKRNCSNSHDMRSWDGFQNAGSGLWPQNQWVAFPGESSYSRVDEWVKDLETLPPPPLDDDDNNEKHIVFPPSPERAKSPAISTTHLYRYPDNTLSEAIMHANSVIQSLNSSSTVAHMAGIGLKVIPTISSFSSLRSVNLSSNFIAHITPGSLPKGLHTLNLSRNKITTIEGLKDLTRLRVLDLSYNRIARIGQGLSNCALIKELYLAGNKISDVEGLHRLLKLTVLDLSFNKITTTKALGQLVANYNSLLALNLLGNPIQSNISDDQLRKAVCGLLPKLTYLNKQPVKPQRAREVLMDSVAKAALKNSSTGSRRRAVKRGNHGVSYSSGGHRSSSSMGHRGKHRSRSQVDNHLPQRAGSRSAAGVFSGYML